ncbi:MAG: hemerythrin domain-containing protein [Proteobacteria bacterium]|nr:hemerythrin domain-containing protein [Pseudomonadota bacterium]
MSHISEILPAHHKHCDELFAAAEEAAQSGDWVACGEQSGRFVHDMLAHFDAEESLLFPAFESATGMSGGPTQIMRMEHGQMRELLVQLESALRAKDEETFAGVAETLLIMMQQHNMKEENILYPMCDQALGAQVERLAGELNTRLEQA